jgi:8-oxo-dGTP pyrophosphatase MutT (NUDIX family)
MSKLVTRRKIIVIPFLQSSPEQDLCVLTVKDRKSKEWTFITGGCKLRETDVQAAQRELREETRSLFDVDIASCPHHFFRFKTSFRETKEWMSDKARNEHVLTLYTVFFVDVSSIMTHPDHFRKEFRNTKNMKGVYNENADVSFDTLESFEHKTHVWRFIREHVLRSSHFRGVVGNLLKDRSRCSVIGETHGII